MQSLLMMPAWTSNQTHRPGGQWDSLSYFANEERLCLFLAQAEVADLEWCGPKCLIHHVVGIH